MDFNNRYSHQLGTPWFFKIWAAFIFCITLSIFGLVGYGMYSIVSNPSMVGQFAGQIVKGFNEASK